VATGVAVWSWCRRGTALDNEVPRNAFCTKARCDARNPPFYLASFVAVRSGRGEAGAVLIPVLRVLAEPYAGCGSPLVPAALSPLEDCSSPPLRRLL
jgi:hypothetical protein